eukprot:CAMPEP_0202894254 /NCGR_PEP_ID=MMETSP1392-20130828/3698_1 /ASSEMBLY_ACC=CAM_ASM_000868 /TAXON_ID=225041 /ORGANISM="Chlamydomonas chlamydogama, Strain SAG 11-48b" /LENGTH=56 /DNA_ID=CAMNT_0049578891 /DNA_START=31 /DNA_END=201 /DNA_ORIENTATION=-
MEGGRSGCQALGEEVEVAEQSLLGEGEATRKQVGATRYLALFEPRSAMLAVQVQRL